MYMCMVHTDLVVALFKLLVYVEKHGKGLVAVSWMLVAACKITFIFLCICMFVWYSL